MKLCILGTSNAVLDNGYPHHLRHHKAIQLLESYSIGMSSSHAFAYWKCQIDFSRFDYCIVDYCVNDTTFFDSRFQSCDHVESCLSECITHLLSKGCIPLLFILPLRVSYNEDILGIYIRLAHRYGIPYFDGYAYLRRCLSKGIDTDTLFEDGFHLHRHISGELAAALVDFALKDSAAVATNTCIVTMTENVFRQANLCFGPKWTISRRGSSLISTDLLDLHAGDTLDVVVDATSELVGIMFDVANTKSVLNASGENNILIDLTSFYFTGHRQKLILAMWPLPVAIKPLNGFIRLNVRDEKFCDVSLRHNMNEEQRNAPAMLGLCGLVFRTASKSFVIPYSGPAVLEALEP